MYPSQQSYMHAQVPQYSLRTISEDTIRSVPPNSGGSRPIAPPIFAASVPPTQTSVPSPARRPLPTPTLPYREHSQTLPVAVASGAESGQLPQFALNATVCYQVRAGQRRILIYFSSLSRWGPENRFRDRHRWFRQQSLCQGGLALPFPQILQETRSRRTPTVSEIASN